MLGTAHMRYTASLGGFHSVASETEPLVVRLTSAGGLTYGGPSRSFKRNDCFLDES